MGKMEKENKLLNPWFVPNLCKHSLSKKLSSTLRFSKADYNWFVHAAASGNKSYIHLLTTTYPDQVHGDSSLSRASPSAISPSMSSTSSMRNTEVFQHVLGLPRGLSPEGHSRWTFTGKCVGGIRQIPEPLYLSIFWCGGAVALLCAPPNNQAPHLINKDDPRYPEKKSFFWGLDPQCCSFGQYLQLIGIGEGKASIAFWLRSLFTMIYQILHRPTCQSPPQSPLRMNKVPRYLNPSTWGNNPKQVIHPFPAKNNGLSLGAANSASQSKVEVTAWWR